MKYILRHKGSEKEMRVWDEKNHSEAMTVYIMTSQMYPHLSFELVPLSISSNITKTFLPALSVSMIFFSLISSA